MAGILQYTAFNQASTSRKWVHKRQNDGAEAPRNSLEFASEESESCNVIPEDVPCSCYLKNQVDKGFYSSGGTPIKRLINIEIPSRASDINKKPGIVARLMGMNSVSSETKPMIHAEKQEDPKTIRRTDSTEIASVKSSASLTALKLKTKHETSSPVDTQYCHQPAKDMEWAQPRLRRHPQEKILQKFKDDFESWQTHRMWEYSRKLVGSEQSSSRHYNCTGEGSRSISSNDNEEIYSVNLHAVPFYHEEAESLSPIGIVILKPCSEEFSIGSSEMQKREHNMEDFLEEVRNRLKFEIEGKPNTRTVRSFGERSADPKPNVWRFADQICSESTRSYENEEMKVDMFVKDMRKLLSERLKSVLGKGAEDRVPLIHAAKKRKNISRLERNGYQSMVDVEAESPQNLVRSFSAPASGTTFVKFLSEGRHVLMGTRVHGKHEACDHKILEARRSRKYTFDIRGRVSNLRKNLALRRKLFGRKDQSADEELAVDELSLLRTFVTTPSVLVNPSFAQENSTEVPPSPASVCSSPPGMCRAGYRSPVSPLGASFAQGHSSSQTSRETCSNAPELMIGRSEQMQMQTRKHGDGDATEIEGNAKAYVRNIITMAGLQEGQQPFDQVIPRLVFDEMKRTARENNKVVVGVDDDDDGTNISHRLLFDLMNEALPRITRGKTLLDGLWSQIERSMNPRRDASCCSIDGIISGDMSTDPWRGRWLVEDIDVVGREIESEILEELVLEFVHDLLYKCK